jgi:hypothetical protein
MTKETAEHIKESWGLYACLLLFAVCVCVSTISYRDEPADTELARGTISRIEYVSTTTDADAMTIYLEDGRVYNRKGWIRDVPIGTPAILYTKGKYIWSRIETRGENH